MDLLLHTDVVVDICTKHQPFYREADLAAAKCRGDGGRLWLFSGDRQRLESLVWEAFRRYAEQTGGIAGDRLLREQARHALVEFCSDKNWLAALGGISPAFNNADFPDAQVLAALEVFPKDEIRLLTRDRRLLDAFPDSTVSPQQYCRLPSPPPRLDFIDLKTQQDAVRHQIERNIHRVLRHGRYILGPEVDELESRLADYVGVKHCICVSSGTDALLVAMMALEIGPDDEVITTPFTFFATGEMIALLGARPVFVDINRRTYNMDPAQVAAAITPKTAAIMPVGLYGQCADMDGINAVAERHGLPVIEDAAQSFGATYKGGPSCGLSTIGCTSFFPAKPLGCYGDGGACFTDDDALARRMRQIAAHGQERHYHHPRIGINGRLDTIQAAVLLAKLAIFPQEVKARARIGRRYTALLAQAVQTPYIEDHNTSVFAQYTIEVPDRDAIASQLREAGIPTAVHYPVPLTSQPALEAFKAEVPNTEAAARRVLSLPMSPWLRETEQDRVTAALRTAVAAG